MLGPFSQSMWETQAVWTGYLRRAAHLPRLILNLYYMTWVEISSPENKIDTELQINA